MTFNQIGRVSEVDAALMSSLYAVPMTQVRTAQAMSRAVTRGCLFAPVGVEYKRAHALVRRGMAKPVHGRKGEGVEHFELTPLGGRLLMVRRFDLHR